jgi:hypothetical protein
MASTCQVFKHGILLADATCAGGSASLTSVTKVAETASRNRESVRRNVQITITQTGVYKGLSWNARVLTDNGSGTFTLSEKCPYTNA